MTYKLLISLVLAQLFVATPLLAADVDYHYSGTLKIDDQSGHIDADWNISIEDDKETAITFLLRDTLSEIEVSGSAVKDATTARQSGMGEFWAITVTLEPATSTQSRVIQLSYNGVLLPEPMENLINGIEPGRVELNVDSFWFPIDSRFTKFLTAELDVHIGDGWQGVTTGEAIAIEDGYKIVNEHPSLDITFSLSKSFHITQAEGFTLYDQREVRKGVDQLVNTASKCRSFLDVRFGENDPLPVANLLITERPSSGYARNNYIAFTDISDTKPGPLTRFVCHEFAHHWSSGAKFDMVDNWLNEAFAEYIGLMAVREYQGQSAYDDMLNAFAKQLADKDLPHIWKRGDTERTSYEVQYRKGPLALAEVEKSIGQDQFLQWLSGFFASSERTTENLLEILENTAGADERMAFESILGDDSYANHTPLAKYLYVWARDAGKEQTDFFSVWDADPGSEKYGQLLSTVPMGMVANAHHSEHFMPEGDRLFMNGFMTGNSFVVNVADPLAPVVESAFTNAGPYTYPHSFERIPGGNVLSTFQNMGAPESGAGGLVELDPLGNFVRGTAAADPVDPELRPYSLAPIPELDRVVTTTGDMWMKLEGRSVQIWRLSDLKLLKTILLPPGPKGNEHLDVAEARLLDDGNTLIVTTFHCGMYVLSGVNTEEPAIEFVHSFPFVSYENGDECGVPWRNGDFWIQNVENTSSLHVLDISDPYHPKKVSELFVGEGEDPHWISGELGGNRIALTGSGPWLDGRVVLIEMNPQTGELSFIENFKSPGADRPGADMTRASWPHGENSGATPHGVVFSRPD